jgi:hypothetical protein
MNLDTFCRMCGGVQYLKQQLMHRAQDAKVEARAATAAAAAAAAAAADHPSRLLYGV